MTGSMSDRLEVLSLCLEDPMEPILNEVIGETTISVDDVLQCQSDVDVVLRYLGAIG